MPSATWNTRAKSDKCNSGDRVFETDRAAEGGCHVADDGRQHADPNDGYNEAKPTSPPIWYSVVFDLYIKETKMWIIPISSKQIFINKLVSNNILYKI